MQQNALCFRLRYVSEYAVTSAIVLGSEGAREAARASSSLS